MLPQWPWVVWATTLQFPSNGEAIADGVEQMVAEAAARAMAQIRLPIIGVLLNDFAAQLDRAVERSRKVSMIEAPIIEATATVSASDATRPVTNGGGKPPTIIDRRYRRW